MPFIKTAYLAPGGSARQGSTGEGIAHFNAIRMRVTGTGNLRQSLYSLDDVESQNLANIAMVSSTNRQPTTLANFIQQRAALRLETTEINEYMRINRIIVFSREMWSSYPG